MDVGVPGTVPARGPRYHSIAPPPLLACNPTSQHTCQEMMFIIIMTRGSCQEARCICRQAAGQEISCRRQFVITHSLLHAVNQQLSRQVQQDSSHGCSLHAAYLLLKCKNLGKHCLFTPWQLHLLASSTKQAAPNLSAERYTLL